MVSFGAAASVALSMVGASFAEGANGLVGPPTLVDDTKRNAGAFRTPPRWERGQAAWHTVTDMAAAPHAACALDLRCRAPVTSRIAED